MRGWQAVGEQPYLAAMQEAQQITQEGQELIREVWGVVADYYLDARGSGFDLDSWTALRDRYLSQPLPTHDAAYRCPHGPHAQATVCCSELLPGCKQAACCCTSEVWQAPGRQDPTPCFRIPCTH